MPLSFAVTYASLIRFERRHFMHPINRLREPAIASEIDFGKKGLFQLRLNLPCKISYFYFCFLSSGIEGSRLRILDIILASFGGDYRLRFLRHFSCIFQALLKRFIHTPFLARLMTDCLRLIENLRVQKGHSKTLLKRASKLCLKLREKTRV